MENGRGEGNRAGRSPYHFTMFIGIFLVGRRVLARGIPSPMPRLPHPHGRGAPPPWGRFLRALDFRFPNRPFSFLALALRPSERPVPGVSRQGRLFQTPSRAVLSCLRKYGIIVSVMRLESLIFALRMLASPDAVRSCMPSEGCMAVRRTGTIRQASGIPEAGERSLCKDIGRKD